MPEHTKKHASSQDEHVVAGSASISPNILSRVTHPTVPTELFPRCRGGDLDEVETIEVPPHFAGGRESSRSRTVLLSELFAPRLHLRVSAHVGPQKAT